MSTHSQDNSQVGQSGNRRTRVVFMGTPSFVVPVLDALHDDTALDLTAVYCPPDRRRGRGQRLESSPVKARAQELGIPVFQPPTFRDPQAIAQLKSCRPDAIVVAAYGRLLPPDALGVPEFGCLNLHPSLLPRYRGPSPVAGTILAGDDTTGVTVMLLDEGMDTGPIIAQSERAISPSDDAISLTASLFLDGASLLLRTLPGWIDGAVAAFPQDDNLSTYTSKLERSDGLADWDSGVETLVRRHKAYAPWPGLYTHWDGKEIKMLEVAPATGPPVESGLVTSVDGAPIAIGAGNGWLAVHRLQMEGRRPATAEDFLRGYPLFMGSRLTKDDHR